ncbi:hypothetical protein TNIN_116651 [Trichonephila inaurata madagascariensis]|uniref:Uncharacterized protein n=1 Tax=Trichonephila inaurata madagascariensis TaxID=2747483 RepID=A0A8X6IIM3_9ARAC|nr:hypothetical protein TNIN_116651 [Trichonephila inaurata madagascariensis]
MQFCSAFPFRPPSFPRYTYCSIRSTASSSKIFHVHTLLHSFLCEQGFLNTGEHAPRIHTCERKQRVLSSVSCHKTVVLLSTDFKFLATILDNGSETALFMEERIASVDDRLDSAKAIPVEKAHSHRKVSPLFTKEEYIAVINSSFLRWNGKYSSYKVGHGNYIRR